MTPTDPDPSPIAASEWLRAFALAALVAFVTAFHAPFDLPLADLFHEGEYLSPRLYFGATGVHPLLIHGQINYWPSELATMRCGADHLIACTRAINAGFTALAGFLLFGCALAGVRSREAMLLRWLGCFALLLMINGRLFDAVALHQGSPSIRDIGLLAIIWCLLAIPGRSGAIADMLAGVAGLVAGAFAFWAYNRGLIGVAIIPLYALVSLIVGKGWRHSLAPILGLAIGLGVIALIEPDMGRQHLSNILYWARHGDIWRFPSPLAHALGNLPFYLIAATIILLSLRRAWRAWREDKTAAGLPGLVVLAAVATLVLQQSSNRDDPIHLMWVVPWLLLLVFRLVDGTALLAEGRSSWAEILRRHSLIWASLAALLLLDFFASVSFVRPMVGFSIRNLALLAQGLPGDSELVPAPTRRIVAALRETGQACTYVFNNGGGFYHLADQRPCSTIMYPVYASPGLEARVIADLEAARPLRVVGLSGDWHSAIDDRTLKMRTPLIAAWLDRHYAVEFRAGGTELRRRIDGPASPPQ